ncbi:DOMON-like domain-containing protein [Candidatus Thiothrix anitrata]|uniref:DOMON-like domain-containing protein n=1 Tax=Candidatus Thiothrix anitrata TaxID=2823902 RepID=A0ABX7X670_9GAMM|nr:DOMON-like domain-containing protein [Candidatus Thiothrix anitrata]QTR50323.1 DOMON-like domain-containing protein [Candidatus Thiothrix anitrata]
MIWELALQSHPATPCPAIHTLNAKVERLADGSLHLQYTLRGDITQVRIPAPQPPVFTDGLWQHTCFEAFVAVKGETAYREFNFSPSSQWAAYAFSDYRQPVESPLLLAPSPPCGGRAGDGGECSEQDSQSTYQLDASIPSSALPAAAPLQLALTAVIELTDGSKSYWALKHPSERPDFHHRDGFMHEIWS